jgi:hypothetical protein
MSVFVLPLLLDMIGHTSLSGVYLFGFTPMHCFLSFVLVIVYPFVLSVDTSGTLA